MTERVTISLEPEVRRTLNRLAEEENTSVSGMIKMWVQKTAEARKKSSPALFSELLAKAKVREEIFESEDYKRYLKTGKARDLFATALDEKHLDVKPAKRKK